MHLTQAQRYEIAALLKTNTPQKKIAEVIGVHPSTICREIKRNLTPAGNYSPTQAQMFAKERQDWKASRWSVRHPFTSSCIKTRKLEASFTNTQGMG